MNLGREDPTKTLTNGRNSRLIERLRHATPSNSPIVPGRRAFFNYRDLGVTDATDGRMRAQVTLATGVMQQTGWHYHICESQFIYALRGWIELQFEDGRTVKLNQGESLYIPPGVRHNETSISSDLELLEISVPAKMSTIACEPPENMRSIAAA